MNTEQAAKTVIVVSASRPERDVEEEREPCAVRVRWAGTIKEAADLLSSAADTTAVVTEVALKDGNWRDVVETVRRFDSCIPVLLMTSRSTAELWWDALECGIDDILPCPLSISRIREYVKSNSIDKGEDVQTKQGNG
jgi:DNA-binding NtrC family response regulator